VASLAARLNGPCSGIWEWHYGLLLNLSPVAVYSQNKCRDKFAIANQEVLKQSSSEEEEGSDHF